MFHFVFDHFCFGSSKHTTPTRSAHVHRHVCMVLTRSFICSSNNHITRIQGMVETLCSAYGTPLNPATHPCDTIKGEVAEDTPLPAQPLLLIKQEAPGGDTLCCAPVPPKGAPLPVGGCCQGPGQAHPGRPDGEQGQAGRAEPGEAQGMGGAGGAGGEVEAQQGEGWPLCTPEVKEENEDSGRQEEREAAHTGFYAFPSLKQLERATEEELRAAGFGWVQACPTSCNSRMFDSHCPRLSLHVDPHELQLLATPDHGCPVCPMLLTRRTQHPAQHPVIRSTKLL